ncbi:ferredoxin family protein [Actinotalea sp.]|uniref:ferredoxin family protein n=1 Tax=Actinotalea sp. TaxID=1872145 RepID=UPI00356B3613
MKIGSVPERLATLHYDVDEEQPHVEVDQDEVRRTRTGPLLVRICPAHVYAAEPDGTISVTAAACLECGTCLAVAPPGTVSWHYPRGGFGVGFREG